MRIALFCPNWVGDLVMATPALRAVRLRYPSAELTAVLRPNVSPVLDGLDLVDRRLLHDPHARGAWGRSAEFLRSLRESRFDLAVLFPNSWRSAWWAWMSGAKERIGIGRNGRGLLLTRVVKAPPARTPVPAIDEYLRIVRHLGCDVSSRTMELATQPEHEHQLDAFWRRQRKWGSGRPGAVCLNPGGAFGAAKHWPAKSFAEVGRRIAQELHKSVLVLCGPAEQAVAREIVRLADHPGVTTIADEPLSLGLTKAAIRRSELLLTTDSGPRHFAAPFQVPVVSLFGPTHIAWSETFDQRSLNLQVDVECGPCQQRVCPLKHHRCMQDLRPDWAFSSAVKLLDQFPVSARAA